MSLRVFDEFDYLFSELLKLDEDVAKFMQGAKDVAKLVEHIDACNSFKLSGLRLKGMRQDWHRQESDKLRLLWGYYNTRNHQDKWSHCNNLQKLKLLHQSKGKLGEQINKEMSAQETLTQALPDPPTSDSDDYVSTGAFDLAAVPIADIPAAAPAAPTTAGKSAESQATDTVSRPPSFSIVDDALGKAQPDDAVDHQKHVQSFRRQTKKPAGVMVQKKPAAANALGQDPQNEDTQELEVKEVKKKPAAASAEGRDANSEGIDAEIEEIALGILRGDLKMAQETAPDEGQTAAVAKVIVTTKEVPAASKDAEADQLVLIDESDDESHKVDPIVFADLGGKKTSFLSEYRQVQVSDRAKHGCMAGTSSITCLDVTVPSCQPPHLSVVASRSGPFNYIIWTSSLQVAGHNVIAKAAVACSGKRWSLKMRCYRHH